MRAWLVLMIALIAAVSALGDILAKRDVLPDGSGDPVYVIVVDHAKGPLPDLAKFHARELGHWSSRIVPQLPESDATLLRQQPTVMLMQRLYGSAEQRPAPALRATITARTASVPNAGTGQWSGGTYDYDGRGNIKDIGPDTDGVTRRYLYDELGRLTSAGYEGPNAPPGTYQSVHTYTYDSFGNRTKETTPSGVQTLTADPAMNRVQSATTPLTYDGVGNVREWNGAKLQYDPAGTCSRSTLPAISGWRFTRRLTSGSGCATVMRAAAGRSGISRTREGSQRCRAW